MGSGIFTNKKYYQDNLELVILGLTSINQIYVAFRSRKKSGENNVFSGGLCVWVWDVIKGLKREKCV